MPPFLDVVVANAYGLALIASFRRWRWRGPVGLALLVEAVEIAIGTVVWALPHEHLPSIPRFEWACYSLFLLPATVLLTIAGLLALIPLRRSAGWGRQIAFVAVSFTLAAPVLLYAWFWWIIDVLGCDTL